MGILPQNAQKTLCKEDAISHLEKMRDYTKKIVIIAKMALLGLRIFKDSRKWRSKGVDRIKIDAPDTREYQEAYKTYLKESMKYTSGITEKLAKKIREQKDAAAAMEFTRVICDMLKTHGVSVIARETTCDREEIDTGTYHAIAEKYGVSIEGLDFSVYDAKFQEEIRKRDAQINELKNELEYKDGTKMFETLMENTDGEAQEHLARHLYDHLKCVLIGDRIADEVNITDFLPAEPIKVADMLINAEREYECNPLEKALNGTNKRSYRMFDISELRQIAEHLLIYCNHNTEAEE